MQEVEHAERASVPVPLLKSENLLHLQHLRGHYLQRSPCGVPRLCDYPHFTDRPLQPHRNWAGSKVINLLTYHQLYMHIIQILVNLL